jgi:hypothetical protein
MTKPKKLPLVSQELLDHLNEMFPERCPDLSDPLDKIRFESGSRQVVRYLAKLKERQEQKEEDGYVYTGYSQG